MLQEVLAFFSDLTFKAKFVTRVFILGGLVFSQAVEPHRFLLNEKFRRSEIQIIETI